MESPDCDLITIGGVDFSDLEDGLSEDEIINNLKKPITPAFFAKLDSKQKEEEDKETIEDAVKSHQKTKLEPAIFAAKEESKGRWKHPNKSRFNSEISANFLQTRNFRNGINRMSNGNPFDSTCQFQEYTNRQYRPPVPLFSPYCPPTMPKPFMNSNYHIRHPISSTMTSRGKFPYNSPNRQPYGFSASSRSSKILSMLSLPNIPLLKPSTNASPLITHNTLMSTSYTPQSQSDQSLTSPPSIPPFYSNDSFTYHSPLSYSNVVESSLSKPLPVPLLSLSYPTPLMNSNAKPLLNNANSACRVTQDKVSPAKGQSYRKKSNIFSKLSPEKVPTQTESSTVPSLDSVPSFISDSETFATNSSSNFLYETSLANSVNVGEPIKSSTPVPSVNSEATPLKIDESNLSPIKTLSAIDPPLLSPLRTPPPPPKIGSSDIKKSDNEKSVPASLIARLGDYVPSPMKENHKDKSDLKDVNRKLFDSAEEDLSKEDDQLGCSILINDLEMSDDNDNDSDDDDDDDLLVMFQTSNSKAFSNDNVKDKVQESLKVSNNKQVDDDVHISTNSVPANPVGDDGVVKSLNTAQDPQIDDNDKVGECPAKEFTRTAFPTIFRIANLAGDTRDGNGYLSNPNKNIWFKKHDHDMTSIDCQVTISNLAKDTRLCDLLSLCEGISDPWAVAKFNETCARISFRTPLNANIFRLKNNNAHLNGNLIRVHKSIIEID